MVALDLEILLADGGDVVGGHGDQLSVFSDQFSVGGDFDWFILA
jgi:hypothetical protein